MYPVFSRTWTCSCSSPCLWLWCTLVLLWPTTPPSASTQWRFQPSSSSCAKSHLSQKKQKQTRLLGPKTESNPVPSWSNQESGPGFSFFFLFKWNHGHFSRKKQRSLQRDRPHSRGQASAVNRRCHFTAVSKWGWATKSFQMQPKTCLCLCNQNWNFCVLLWKHFCDFRYSIQDKATECK